MKKEKALQVILDSWESFPRDLVDIITDYFCAEQLLSKKETALRVISDSWASFPLELAFIITNYLCAEQLLSKWKEILKSDKDQETKDYNPYTEMETELFTVLGALDTSPEKPLTIFGREYKNAIPALDAIINEKVNDCSPFSNFYGYYNSPYIVKNPDFSAGFKELLLLLPDSKEHTLDLVEYFPMLISYENAVPSVSYFEMVNDYLLTSVESDDRPWYNFDSKRNVLSLITSPQHLFLDRLICKILPRYKKEAEAYEKRFSNSLLAEMVSVTILPTVLWQLISSYHADPVFLSQSLRESLKNLLPRYHQESARLATGMKKKVIRTLKKILQAIQEDESFRFQTVGYQVQDDKFDYKAINTFKKFVVDGILFLNRQNYNDKGDFKKVNLLSFFKDLFIHQTHDADVEQFMLDLLELADTHIPLDVEISKLQMQCNFPSLTHDSPLEEKINAEKALNHVLNQIPQPKKMKNPVNFLTVTNTNTVRLFVKKDANFSLNNENPSSRGQIFT